MGFRQSYYEQAEKVESYKEIKVKAGTVFIKKPGMGALDASMDFNGKSKKISDKIIDFMINNIYEKDEKGKMVKVFEPADRAMLYEKTTDLHTKVISFYTESINELSEEEEKK